MKRLAPLLVLLTASLGVWFLSASFEGVEGEREVALAVAPGQADQASHFVAAAARDLGFRQVRAYSHGVFIEVDEASRVGFFPVGDRYVMNVGFDTRYRMPSKELKPALDALQAKGQQIWQKAQALQEAERARANTVVVSDAAARPQG